jgi:uncharacterized RDD family membrane protein YckC
MENKELPLKIDGISNSLYAGFWLRLGASLLDFIFTIPVVGLVMYLNSRGKNVYLYTFIPSLIFGLWYYVYFTKVHGGTPGKLAVGTKIIRLDGQPIGWKEAILRHLVLFILTIGGSIISIYALTQTDDATYMSYGWLQQSQYLVSVSPKAFSIYSWATNIWFWGEFIVLLTNKKKRAPHDFIAGTVVVKKEYLQEIGRDVNTEIDSIGSVSNI